MKEIEILFQSVEQLSRKDEKTIVKKIFFFSQLTDIFANNASMTCLIIYSKIIFNSILQRQDFELKT